MICLAPSVSGAVKVIIATKESVPLTRSEKGVVRIRHRQV